MHAGRAVGHDRGGNAQPGDAHRESGGPGHNLLLMAQHGSRAYKAVVAAARQQLGFLFQRHGGYHFTDVVRT